MLSLWPAILVLCDVSATGLMDSAHTSGRKFTIYILLYSLKFSGDHERERQRVGSKSQRYQAGPNIPLSLNSGLERDSGWPF